MEFNNLNNQYKIITNKSSLHISMDALHEYINFTSDWILNKPRLPNFYKNIFQIHYENEPEDEKFDELLLNYYYIKQYNTN